MSIKSVLVVDDKEMMRDSVGSTLTRAGFSVRTAVDARSALKEITSRRPDVVVTDLNMPGMTGVDLAGEIQSIDDELPVILMTAFGTIETGKVADLVLVRQNPLEDISVMSAPWVVVKRGQWLSTKKLHALKLSAKNPQGFYWGFIAFVDDLLERKFS